MADIIDTAAEIQELQRNAALSAHRLNRNVSVVKNAANQFPSRAALPFPAARRARSARVSKKNAVNIRLFTALIDYGDLGSSLFPIY